MLTDCFSGLAGYRAWTPLGEGVRSQSTNDLQSLTWVKCVCLHEQSLCGEAGLAQEVPATHAHAYASLPALWGWGICCLGRLVTVSPTHWGSTTPEKPENKENLKKGIHLLVTCTALPIFLAAFCLALLLNIILSIYWPVS